MHCADIQLYTKTHCEYLRKIVLHNPNIQFGEDVFYACENLETVVKPNGISDEVFAGTKYYKDIKEKNEQEVEFPKILKKLVGTWTATKYDVVNEKYTGKVPFNVSYKLVLNSDFTYVITGTCNHFSSITRNFFGTIISRDSRSGIAKNTGKYHLGHLPSGSLCVILENFDDGKMDVVKATWTHNGLNYNNKNDSYAWAMNLLNRWQEMYPTYCRLEDNYSTIEIYGIFDIHPIYLKKTSSGAGSKTSSKKRK